VIGSSTAAAATVSSTDSTKDLLKIPQEEAHSSHISPQDLSRSKKQRIYPLLGASVDTEKEAGNKDKYVSLILTSTVHDVVSSPP
jgi:hypothetical protein